MPPINKETTSVLIVGGGPCGLTLAIELGRRRIDAILVDPKLNTSGNPQANATQARTMEHFRRLGFADEVRALGLPKDYPTDIAYFTRYGGLELARFRLPSAREASDVARNLNGSWSTSELPHRVSQKFVEEVLHRYAAAEETISLNYGWKLSDFSEEAGKVVARVQNVRTSGQRIISADYLIGVDGARSTVRRQLDIPYKGETGVIRDFFGGKMVAVYLRAPDFYKVTRHEPAWMYWAFNSSRRSWLAAVNGKDEFAFHTQLKAGEDATDLSQQRARTLFSEVMAVPLEIEVLNVDTWTAGHALVAESFGGGRVYIGGDAAHLFTPAGGLGYNTAVEDAVNLAWKLAAAVRGKAGPALLPSYATERSKLAIRNTGYARQLANSIGSFVPHPQLESDTPEGEAARDQASNYLNAHARREFNIPGITFGGRYDGSPVIISDGAELPEDAPNKYMPTASPGGRPPHLWLDDGRSLYDLFGSDWTLLSFDPSLNTAAFTEAAGRLGLDLKIVVLDSPDARMLYEADFALLRPDQIVAWRGGRARLNCDHLFGHLMGFLPAGAPKCQEVA